ncbi:MAG: hypothetical protein PWP58_803 [Bacillota bacterium]|jgi:gas vesicle protein|nr:hypothetical protein [Bacillota bacterium]
MRRKFWQGMIAGGVVGGLLGLLAYPTLKPETKQRITQAQQKLNRLREGLMEMWRRRAKD